MGFMGVDMGFGRLMTTLTLEDLRAREREILGWIKAPANILIATTDATQIDTSNILDGLLAGDTATIEKTTEFIKITMTTSATAGIRRYGFNLQLPTSAKKVYIRTALKIDPLLANTGLNFMLGVSTTTITTNCIASFCSSGASGNAFVLGIGKFVNGAWTTLGTSQVGSTPIFYSFEHYSVENQELSANAPDISPSRLGKYELRTTLITDPEYYPTNVISVNMTVAENMTVSGYIGIPFIIAYDTTL